jgi:exopolysaccharide production protein ExoY
MSSTYEQAGDLRASPQTNGDQGPAEANGKRPLEVTRQVIVTHQASSNGARASRNGSATAPQPFAYAGLKRTADLLGAGAGLVLSLPVLLLLALAVKLSSPGPVFFRHARVGLDGKGFYCYKLRTMVRDAERRLREDPELQARHRQNGFKLPTREDPRVTRLGRFLRRTHLDELPQLWNVFRGEMSLVGPRPIVDEELLHYGDRQREFLSVRPGIFGPWTAQGRCRVDYPERVEVELSYGKAGSATEDLRILVRHLPVLARGQESDRG